MTSPRAPLLSPGDRLFICSHPLCLAGCEDISSADPWRAGKGAEPVPGSVLHLSPQPQWNHPQRVHGSPQTGMTRQPLDCGRVVEYLHSSWVGTLTMCAVCSEKSPGHPLGRGAEGPGAADHERGGEPEQGFATQLPHSQHVQRGPRGHLHQGGRCQTLAGQRSVATLSVFITKTRKSSADPDWLSISELTPFISPALSVYSPPPLQLCDIAPSIICLFSPRGSITVCYLCLPCSRLYSCYKCMRPSSLIAMKSKLPSWGESIRQHYCKLVALL